MNAIAKRIVVTAVTVPLLLLLWLLADGTRPYLRAGKPVIVDIPRGVRTLAIATQLEEAGAIRSRWTFLGLHLLRWGNSLKAGEYEFAQPSSTLAVLSKIVRGDVSYEVLTVPEGDNRFDIADLVAAQGFSTRDEFLRATEDPQPVADIDPEAKDLEGYLFPDSYRLPRHARPAEIVREMVKRFRQVAAPLKLLPAAPAPTGSETAAASTGGTPPSQPTKPAADPPAHPPVQSQTNPAASDQRPLREIVTIASMVEKETALPAERPVVAGVFYTRLKRGLLLQCDPTVVYAALLANRFTGRIRKEDLTFDSPYNTYVEKGLPAGPIANPGRAALLAALHPAPTDFLYFVANDEGGHTFSKTLDEHNLAVEKYRQDHAARLAALASGMPAAAAASPSIEIKPAPQVPPPPGAASNASNALSAPAALPTAAPPAGPLAAAPAASSAAKANSPAAQASSPGAAAQAVPGAKDANKKPSAGDAAKAPDKPAAKAPDKPAAKTKAPIPPPATASTASSNSKNP